PAVSHQVLRHGTVRFGRIERGRPDLVERAPDGQVLEVLRDVVPGPAVVFRVPELAVVGAGPDQSALDLRVLDRPDDFAVVLAQVVADQTAVGDDARWILRREIRAELGPRLAAVRRLQDQ